MAQAAFALAASALGGGPVLIVAASAAGAYLDRKYLFRDAPPDIGDALNNPDLQNTSEGGPAISLIGETCRVRGQVIWQSNIFEFSSQPVARVAIAFSTDHTIYEVNKLTAEGFFIYTKSQTIVINPANITWQRIWSTENGWIETTDTANPLDQLVIVNQYNTAMTGWSSTGLNFGNPSPLVGYGLCYKTEDLGSSTRAYFIRGVATGQPALPFSESGGSGVTITQTFATPWNPSLIVGTSSSETHTGAYTQALSTTMATYEQEQIAWGGKAYAFLDALVLTQFGGRVPDIVASIAESSAPVSIQSAVSKLHSRQGWDNVSPFQTPAQLATAGSTNPRAYDVSGLATDRYVRGYTMRGSQSLAKRLESIQLTHDFVVQMRDGVATYLHPEDRRIWEVPGDHVDVVEVGQDGPASIQVNQTTEPSLPTKVTVRYVDSSTLEDAAQHYQRSAYVSNTETTLELNLTSSPSVTLSTTEARDIAERLCRRPWRQRRKVRFSLPPRYHHIIEHDAFQTTDPEGDTITVVVESIERGANWQVIGEGFIQDDEDFGPSNPGADEGFGAGGEDGAEADYSRSVLLPVVLDLPPINPGEEEGPANYAFVCHGDIRAEFTPGRLQMSSASGSWVDVAKVNAEATMGYVSSSSGCGAEIAGQTDQASVLDVTLLHGELASATRDEIADGENLAVVGSEIISFQGVEALGDDEYRLTVLNRGLLDTDSAAHNTVGEQFVLLSGEYIAWRRAWSDIGTSRTFRAIPLTTEPDDAVEVSATFAATNMRPWRVFNIQGVIDGGNDWDLTWQRKTRQPGESILSPYFIDPDPRDYTVTVYSDGTFTTVKRTISASGSESATYTSAQQVTDFAGNQTTIYIGITRDSIWGSSQEVQVTLT